MGYLCFICKADVGVKDLRWHFKNVHSIFDDSHLFMCFQDNCMRTFSRYGSYRKHLLNTHPLDCSSSHQSGNCSTQDTVCAKPVCHDESGVVEVAASVSEYSGDDDDDLNCQVHDFDEHGVSRDAALFVARLHASSSVTSKSVATVIDGVTNMIDSIVDNLATFAAKSAERASRNPAKVSHIKQEIKNHFESRKHVFQGLHTPYRETKYFQNCGALLLPEEKTLGQRIEQHTNAATGNVRQCITTDTYFYVPMKANLKKFLELPGVLTALEETQRKYFCDMNLGTLRNFHDGCYAKQHPVFSKNDRWLAISLYNDDMETANPLGSHATVHKLGFFYYIVQNLPARYNSMLANCFLLQVYFAEDRKKYGINKILETIVQELKDLEIAGIDITVENIQLNVKVSLCQISGDNLGIHQLLGFVESFSANRPCRYCCIHKNDMHVSFSEDAVTLRNRANYAEQLKKVEADPSCVSDFGVSRNSVLNELHYFHVTENYTPDIMHDLLEGVCPYVMKLVLKALILDKKIFSLDLLNERIKSFNYGPQEFGNKPTEVSRHALAQADGHLKLAAMEAWCLMVNLPMLIGDHVPENDEHWEFFILLLEIASIVFAPAMSEGATYYLQELILDHLKTFCELFPDKRIKPKQHFLIHYPRCIRLVGPLIRFWCMRFEAKHNFFRRLSHIVCCFKNICKTMAYRHQMYLCYRFYSQEHIDAKQLEVGNGHVVVLGSVEQGQSVSSLLGLGTFEDVFLANWVRIWGTTYRPNMFLIVKVDAEGNPCFGRIMHIVVLDGSVTIIAQAWHTLFFHRHFFSYCIEKSEPSVLHTIKPNEMTDPHPYHGKCSFVERDSNVYVTMRHKPWYP